MQNKPLRGRRADGEDKKIRKNWLKEALFNGMTANAFKLGTVLSLGWFWMRHTGFHVVYRGQDGNMDYDRIQALMELDDDQVSIEFQNLPANTIWHFVRRQVSCCGLESEDSPACIVFLDENGDMIGNTPNPPISLIIEGLSNARFRLRWRYTPLEEEISPTGFNIYMDSGSGFDFETPEDNVLYGTGRGGEYDWISGPLTNGKLYRFCVRSYRTDAGESQNTNYVAAVADSIGPDAITDLRASWQEV